MKPQLDEIKEALSKATPGPWQFELLDEPMGGRQYLFGKDKQPFGRVQSISDANLIANAPQWLAFLLEELDQERASHNITSGFFDNLIIRSKEIEESLVSQVEAMQQELERTTKERDQLQHRIRVVGLANDTLGRYVREAREELEQVKKERGMLQNDLKMETHDRETWEAEVQKLAEERHDLINEVDAQKDVIFALRSELAAKDKVLKYVAMRIGQWDADGVNPDVYELLEVVRQTLQQVKGDNA